MHRARARRRPCATAAAPAADASRARPGGPAVFQRAWRSRPPSGIGCSEVSGCPAILRGNRRGPRERDAARCHSPSRVGRNGGSGARGCRQAVALLDVRQVFGRDLEGESDAVARQAAAVGAQHDGSDLLEQRRPVFACSDADRHRARVPVVPTRPNAVCNEAVGQRRRTGSGRRRADMLISLLRSGAARSECDGTPRPRYAMNPAQAEARNASCTRAAPTGARIVRRGSAC